MLAHSAPSQEMPERSGDAVPYKRSPPCCAPDPTPDVVDIAAVRLRDVPPPALYEES